MADVGMDEQEWMKLVEEMDAIFAAEGAAEKAELEEQEAAAEKGKGRREERETAKKFDGLICFNPGRTMWIDEHTIQVN